MTLRQTIFFLLLLAGACNGVKGQQPYPYPVKYIGLNIERQVVKMAYMDVMPKQSPRGTVILFHGKNFNGYYWKDVAKSLADHGYRVIIPDQVGWGKSDAPDIHYSFHLLASNNKALLDSLNVSKVIVIGHSMGGMLAARFVLMYPEMVEKLILENPIGLEDYQTFVPYISPDEEYRSELSATYESYKKYMQSYFPEWKPEYEELVKQQAEALSSPAFSKIAWANALTYEMIYEQPVCYEFKNIKAKTLLIIGQADRTIVGKDKIPKSVQDTQGQYPLLGRKVHGEINNSKLVELNGVGHIPHIQQFENFKNALYNFLNN